MSIFSSLILILLLLPLPLLLLTSFITPSSSASEVAYIYGGCSQAKFMQGSAYESGVKSVLTAIVNAAMFSSYNNLTVLASSSSTSSQDIPIYGLFQCRGDLAAANCSHCVGQAISQLVTICPDFTGGALQLDGCFVMYDDSKFLLGREDNTLVLRKCGPPDGISSDVLTQRDVVLAYLETSDGLYNMFRTTSSGNLQGMAQCVGDLSASECQDCLSNAIGRLKVECGSVQWGQIYLAKCYARYSEGADQSPDGNSKQKNKNKNNKLKKLKKTIAITVGSTAAGATGGSLLTMSVSAVIKKYKRYKRKKGDSSRVGQPVKASEALTTFNNDGGEGGDGPPGTKDSSGPIKSPFTSSGFQVVVRDPIYVHPVAAAGAATAGGGPPTNEPVDDCPCDTGDCTGNNGHFLPWNNGPLPICNY